MATVLTANTVVPSAAKPVPGFWRRAFDRLVEARMRAAEREVRRRQASRGYSPLVEDGIGAIPLGQARGKLPFNG